MGCSVTQRISQIRQPRGGFIKPSELKVTRLNDGKELVVEENIHSSLIGLAVDYLTRFMNGNSGMKAFEISLFGAQACEKFGLNGNAVKDAMRLIAKVKGLDDDSIRAACQLSGYDVCYRAGPFGYCPVEDINPDEKTIANIRIMVQRSVCFLKERGPLVFDGFTFEGGYTGIISTGDGDYLTKDALWDFKVSVKGPTSKHTLQILIYWIMGLHSKHKEFEAIKKLGIYNPRTNIVYEIETTSIPKVTIETVEKEVIGY